MEYLKLTVYAVGLTLAFMTICTLGAIFAPFIVLYFVCTEWQDIKDDDSSEDEMYNAR
jgi:hypothetical protein